ncbi:MAG TPA: ABC transporter ATP-binding protein, partial [Polyangiales bacterium]|nr:ABC transporter ATP-binding protein [Polyangiales bacterium]
ARVYEKLHTLNFRFFDEQSSGSLLNRITGDVQNLRSFIDTVLIQSAVVALALAVNIAYMLSKHVGLTLVCTASAPFMVWITTRFSRRVQPAYAENRAQVDELVLNVSEAIRGIHVIKSFAAEETVRTKFATQNAAVRDGQQRIFEQVSRFTPSVDLLSHLNVIGLLCYGGLLVARGRLTVGDLIVFASLLQQLQTQVSTMSTVINTLQESLIGAARVFEVLDADTPIHDPATPLALPAGTLSLRFDAVSFSHDQHSVLSAIDLEVRPGECVALFGPPGAGKSTLLSLVPRFHDVSSGRITLNGIDLRALELDDLRRRVGIVFQETFLFSHSVAANIAFGRPDATPQQIERAARLASAHDFISALPEGYETLLGELGANLSGGQRQRLALARALLTEPDVLLLDDPTAAVDAETAQLIVNSLRRAKAGRTTLLCTHHASLLHAADRVVVLSKGRIVQEGTFAQLNEQGAFAELLGKRRSWLPGELNAQLEDRS